MGAIKFFDDPSIKFIDDPQAPSIKAKDDQPNFTIKSNDDQPTFTVKNKDDQTTTIKSNDDQPTFSIKNKDDQTTTIKSNDDQPTFSIKNKDDQTTTIKSNDDQPTFSVKWKDDHPKFKAVDDPTHSLKGFDDIKHPAYDIYPKYTGMDQMDPRFFDPYYQSAQPFVLSTPHHSMEWAKSLGYEQQDPNDPKVQLTQFEEYIKELESMRVELQKQQKQLEDHYQLAKKEFNSFLAKQKKTKTEKKTTPKNKKK